jgi:hypothetical protein
VSIGTNRLPKLLLTEEGENMDKGIMLTVGHSFM